MYRLGYYRRRPRRRESRRAHGGVRAPSGWDWLKVEREPYNLLFGERKGSDGLELARAPANDGRPGKFYKGVLAAEPGADDRRRAEPRIMAQREARQSPLYFDLTTSWSERHLDLPR